MTDPAYSEFKPPNSKVTKIKISCPWYSWSEQLKMPRILLEHRLDLVHFPQFNVPILYPKKFIVTIHDITHKFFPGPIVKKSIIRKLGYQVVFRLSLKKTKKIIANSAYTKKSLSDHFGVKPDKIIITSLGLNNAFKIISGDKSITNIKRKFGITKPFLFYVGVWRDHKNLPGLISAFNILRSKYNLDYQLVLAGRQDPRYPEINQAIHNCACQTDIITPGFINEQDLVLLYNAAKLFVLPSFAEGFGLVALEALACGTPVVGSNSTSLPEVLEDAALYFDPYNHSEMAEIINKVLTRSDLYQNLIAKGINQVNKYSWRSCAEKTLKVYESV